MRIKKINLSMSKPVKEALLSWMFACITFAIAYFYGPLGMTNPFFVLGLFFCAQMSLIILTGLYEKAKDSELKNAVTFGPLKLIAVAVIFACTMPSQSVLLLLVPGAVICLLFAGLNDLLIAGRCVWDKYHDHKTFNSHMKEVAQTARIEEELSSDLANFLTGADSAGKQKN